jgi:hypothetical protein
MCLLGAVHQKSKRHRKEKFSVRYWQNICSLTQQLFLALKHAQLCLSCRLVKRAVLNPQRIKTSTHQREKRFFDFFGVFVRQREKKFTLLLGGGGIYNPTLGWEGDKLPPNSKSLVML